MTAEIDPSLPGGALPSPGAALSPGASFSGARGGSTVIPQPVPDRPLTFMDILDGAFSVVRARPRTVALILAVFVLPAHLVASWAQRNLFAAIDFTEFDTETGQFENQAEFESLTSPAAALGPRRAARLCHVAVRRRRPHPPRRRMA